MWKLLLAAIAKGDVVTAKKLIKSMKSFDFNKDCSNLSYDQIPLHYAAYLRREAIVDKLLIARPELIKIVDKNGQTALHIAVSILNNEIIVNKILTVVNKILTVNPDLFNTVDEHNKTVSDMLKSNNKEIKMSKLLTVELVLATVAATYEIENVYTNNLIRKLSTQESAIKRIIKTKNVLENNLEHYFDLHKNETFTVNDKIDSIKSVFTINNYSNEKISRLLDLQIKGPNIITNVIDLELSELSKDRIESLLKLVIEKGKTAAIALHLHEKSWAGLVIKKQANDILQVLYNDSRGYPFAQEKKVKSLINNIKNLEDKVSVFDLRQIQQITNNDSGAFVVDNLVTLSKTNTDNMKKQVLEKLLSKQDQVNEIKINHLIMEDTNPWYSDYKINKLLHLKLDGKDQISIASITVFENKNSLIANVTTATEEVINNDKIAVMPIHLHVNHWTALVIKKQTDGYLQILYNDPKGNSLMGEKNSGTFIKTVSKINSQMIIIDIRLKQQDNDDDCGPFTIENLVKLATSNTNHLHTDQLQKLLQIDNYDAYAIRDRHATELNKVGIISVKPSYDNKKLTSKEISELCAAFDLKNLGDYEESEFFSANDYEVQNMGDSSLY